MNYQAITLKKEQYVKCTNKKGFNKFGHIFYYVTFKMVDCNLQRSEVFQNNRQACFIQPYCLTFKQQVYLLVHS